MGGKDKADTPGQCPKPVTRSQSNEFTSKQPPCPHSEENVHPDYAGSEIPENLSSLIKKLVIEEVQALSSGIDHSAAEKADLKDKVCSLEKRLKITEGLLVQMQTKIKRQNETILDLQTRSMRDNLVIRGVTEDQNESWEKTREKVVHFMRDELHIADANPNMIDRAHRTGNRLPNKPRNIVAKFSSSDAKGRIFQNIRNLAGKKNFGIQEQLPPEIQERRNRLWPKFKEAKAQSKQNRNLKVSWSYDKLKINNTMHDAKDDVQNINPNEIANTNLHLKHSSLVTEKGSSFQGHSAVLNKDVSVSSVLGHLLENRAIAQADHNIYAYRFGDGATLKEACSDDGEHGAGTQLLNLLREDGRKNTIVICTRWFGGMHIGPKRFELIKNCAREALGKMTDTSSKV